MPVRNPRYSDALVFHLPYGGRLAKDKAVDFEPHDSRRSRRSCPRRDRGNLRARAPQQLMSPLRSNAKPPTFVAGTFEGTPGIWACQCGAMTSQITRSLLRRTVAPRVTGERQGFGDSILAAAAFVRLVWRRS
jgi:hypothetical protein